MTTATEPKKSGRTSFDGQNLKYKKRERNPNYIVKPNLGLKGKDIRTRFLNRSLQPDPTGNQYSIEAEIDAARRMNKLELHDAAKNNAKKIGKLTSDISKAIKPQSNG